MALIDKESSKYASINLTPGAMYGGAIYASNARILNATNTEFINNAVIEQGGAIYMSLYADSAYISFDNVTLKDNFSFSEGRDLIGIYTYIYIYTIKKI